MHRLLAAVMVVACVLPTGVTARADDVADAAIRQITTAVTPQRELRHLPLLTALRQLRDPAMRPLLFQLVQSEGPLIQAQGVLGVAELDPERKIDPWLATQVDAGAQEVLITQALDEELMGDEQIDEMLRWGGLPPLARQLLWAERIHDRTEPTAEQIRAAIGLAEEAKDIRTFGLAACLLAERGDDSALESYRQTIAELNRRGQVIELRWALEAMRQYKLGRSLALADDALAIAGRADLDLVSAALLAALDLDPASGMSRWTRALEGDDSYPRRVRLGMILLATGATVPADAYDLLSGGEELIEAIVTAGRAISSGADPTDALIALVDLGHGASGDWVTLSIGDLPADGAQRLCDHLIDTLPDEPTLPQMTYAVRAASHLARTRVELALHRLAEAPDDSVQQLALMLGLLEVSSPAVRDAAAAIPRTGPGRADSTALVLLARNVDSLGEADLRQLGIIAAGGGRVSEMLRVQAAWLYLKLTGQVDAALARIF
ncbi:MAG: hypothetical protein ACYTJ0_10780 [Planctomycetota bacterium]|jgi:hypothetical protein